MAELLLGCGNKREKIVVYPGHAELKVATAPRNWAALTTLDNDPDCKADVEFDLNRIGRRGDQLPFGDDSFDEIHAYHVLEHLSSQGDFRGFFAEFSEFWRVMKPGGLFCGIIPFYTAEWAWGDPGHTRVIPPATMTFLDQTEYTKQVGKTALADYRRFYRADFYPLAFNTDNQQEFFFVLQAVKPSRISI